MSIKRQILLVVVLSSLIFGGYVVWQRYEGQDFAVAKTQTRSGSATKVEAVAAEARKITTTIDAVGTTVASKSVEIIPRAEGRIEKINFSAGGDVKEGDVLVELDSNLERADLAEAKALLHQADMELDRAKSLSSNNFMAKSSLDQAVTKRATAEAALVRAQQKLDERSVKAPFDGTTGIRKVDVGAHVTDSTVITTLDDLSNVELEFSVSEQLFAVVKKGEKIEADTAAYPGRVFEGTVTEIDSRIDPASRSFKVRARIPNEDRALPAGMFMHVQMVLASDDALAIPEEAIVAEAQSNFVFVVDGNKVERREIKVGRREVGYAEITEGLSQGALVVTRGVSKLRDGTNVEIAGGAPEAKQ
jgi:membrane fusion protein (multidrug efflux system)